LGERIAKVLHEIRVLRKEVDIPVIAAHLRWMEVYCYRAAASLEVEDAFSPELAAFWQE
jgi:hypothetical protein